MVWLCDWPKTTAARPSRWRQDLTVPLPFPSKVEKSAQFEAHDGLLMNFSQNMCWSDGFGMTRKSEKPLNWYVIYLDLTVLSAGRKVTTVQHLTSTLWVDCREIGERPSWRPIINPGQAVLSDISARSTGEQWSSSFKMSLSQNCGNIVAILIIAAFAAVQALVRSCLSTLISIWNTWLSPARFPDPLAK